MSFRNSKRQIRNVEFQYIRPSTVISIIQQFSLSINDLNISSYCPRHVTMSEFLEILSLVPNVQTLTLGNLVLNRESNEKISCNDELNLKQLKVLNFYDCDDEFMAVFRRLPEGVLTELRIIVSNLDVMFDVFKRQTNIKKLYLESYNSARDPENLTQLLSTQTKLKSLSLGRKMLVHENFVNFVANQFTELESFEIHNSCDSPSAALIAKISNLKTMKNLSIWIIDFEVGRVKSLIEYHNPGITELMLNIRNLDVNSIHQLGNSVPNLKVLIIQFARLDLHQLNAIMKIFNFVEFLEIPVNSDNHIAEGDYYNPKLTKLEINFDNTIRETQILDKFIACYPNLKKLKIEGYSIAASQFRRIFDGYLKLESLELSHGVWDLTMDDLYYLKDHGKNLKKICLRRCVETLELDELKRQLGDIFGVIIYRHRSLRMAIGKITLNKRW